MELICQKNKTNQMLLFLFSIYILAQLFSPMALAGESYPETGRDLKIESHEENNIRLTRIFEDRAIINGIQYIFNQNTRFYIEDEFGLLTTTFINKIILPRLVDIKYNTFSVSTEAMPFNPEDRLLTEVTIKWNQEE